MVRIFKEDSGVSYNDGMEFDPNSVKVNRIREKSEYGGLRISADALVDTAKARIVIDMAFGDAVEPGILEMDLSVLHDLPAPHLCAYAREMGPRRDLPGVVMLGRANIRGARGLSLARRFEGFGTHSCYPSALICRPKYLTSAPA
ncbi:hypothetical protein [Bradyrhizobium cajani]|uniref:Uncharacterized protein n=1 Tax=Bradyrhizobium cajani TaxID=1928661 RepID=A0A844T831_9BRAD|nr:hypothetical protein [Bradyrhizobium cajani]MCP3367707.1 hypothetical protein [Bradyrhizobium cajani]MVT73755.1 hypothetical protein [Bradyrhizobium cajani]